MTGSICWDTYIFTFNKGDHAGEPRVSLKARLIKVDWINIGQQMVHKAERVESPLRLSLVSTMSIIHFNLTP
ncbi:DUF3577 domain-containing protein [Pectobacterium brasiliense]|nr:DUF3577 domain-containing protein [Pectobacterium brasiliense]